MELRSKYRETIWVLNRYLTNVQMVRIESDGRFKVDFLAPKINEIKSLKFSIESQGVFYTKSVKVTMDE